MKTRIVASLCVLLGALMGQWALAQDKPTGTPLTGAEIQKLVSGAVVDASNPIQKWKGTLVFLADGTAYIQVLFYETGKAAQDSGTWRIAGDRICVQWKVQRGGTENCIRHFKVGDNLYQSWYEVDGKTALSMMYRVRL